MNNAVAALRAEGKSKRQAKRILHTRFASAGNKRLRHGQTTGRKRPRWELI